jgi:hypothetical protein
MSKIIPLCAIISLSLVSCAYANTRALSNSQLTKLVSGHSIVGTSTNQHHMYAIYFSPNGKLALIKNENVKKPYFGSWWVKKDHIFSKLHKYRGQTVITKLNYYHVKGNVYEYEFIKYSPTTRKIGAHFPFIVYNYKLPSFNNLKK